MRPQTNAIECVDQESIITAWLARARLDGKEDIYAGKRRWPRVTWHVPVTLEADLGRRKRQALPAIVRDISLGGMGIKIRRRIQAMTMVRIYADDCSRPVCGRVLHCTDTVGGFIVGIEFLPREAVLPFLRRSA